LLLVLVRQLFDHKGELVTEALRQIARLESSRPR
jgi:hypothetical protein